MTASDVTGNVQIVKLLRSVAAALSLSGEDNRFRITAYEHAADAIDHSTSEAKDLWDDGKLKDLPGIGENIASYLDELFRTGKVLHFSQILKPFPPAMFELLDIPGIGPVSSLKLCKALGISRRHQAISRLEKAAKSGHIRSIEGFGLQSEADIIKNISILKGRSGRMLLPRAQALADSIIDWMGKDPSVIRVDPLGSLRRRVPTIGDIDIAVASDHPRQVISHFLSYPKKVSVVESGEKTATIQLPGKIDIDLMVQPPDSYGSLFAHFTGSKLHNIALRDLALKKGLSLSEYGIKAGERSYKFPDEESFYNFLGLVYIPPELRENNGEINAAIDNELPKLVELHDIKGDLHLHSSINVEPGHDSGTGSIQEMVEKASRLNYEYIGLTEHNPASSGHSDSQIMQLIKRKAELIAQYNYSGHAKDKRIPYVFNGLEVDILNDGRLALPDGALNDLDYVCVGIHGSFNLSRRDMTERIIRALSHPEAKFLSHPTCRLLGEREGIEIDWDRLFDFCLTHSKYLEINSSPNRLDLPDSLVKEAVNKGVKIVINTDSHSLSPMENLTYGVSVARRGWAKASDIINTLGLEKIKHIFSQGGE